MKPTRPRTVTHLGDRVVDLLDGRLSASEEAVVREHLAGCRSCADVVHAQREVRTKLRAAASPIPAPDDSMMAGLMSLSSSARLGQGALLTPPTAPPAVSAPPATQAVRGVPAQPGYGFGTTTSASPDSAARWVFAAALAGGVSLVALGASSMATTVTTTPRQGAVVQSSLHTGAVPTAEATRVQVSTAWLRAGTSIEPVRGSENRND